MYQISVRASAEKSLKKLPKKDILRIIKVIDGLKENPKPHGYKLLKGNSEDIHRVRTGDYRILYHIDYLNFRIDIRQVAHRKDVYKKL